MNEIIEHTGRKLPRNVFIQGLVALAKNVPYCESPEETTSIPTTGQEVDDEAIQGCYHEELENHVSQLCEYYRSHPQQ